MRLNSTLLGWGVFFLLLGGIPLAVRQGVIPAESVERAWTLWPLLLVAAGIGLLLRRTQFEILGGLLAAATFGVIAGGALATGGIPFASCGDERGSVDFPAQQGTFAGSGTVEVNLNCGDLTVATAPGSGWIIEGSSEDGHAPRVQSSPDRVKVDSAERGFDFLGARERWAVTIGTEPAVGISGTINAADARLRLNGARLGAIDLQVNASAIRIDLAGIAAITGFELHLNAGEARIALPTVALSGSIDANAAAVKLCPPAGVGLRIETNDNITASNNFDERGLVERSKNVWETVDLASAAVRIELDASVNAGSIEIESEGSCND
ncbi:MAG TPA: hypothetical protein VH723_05570 [Candidatus Limnocylindrales bacterium]|jgi:hypothetical protein